MGFEDNDKEKRGLVVEKISLIKLNFELMEMPQLTNFKNQIY